MGAAEEYRPELLKPLLAELAAGGTPGEIRVRGGSMRPTLEEGDRVRLLPATASGVRVGDLIVWQAEDGPILHRLVGWWPIGGWRMLTMGDACRRLDPPAPPDRVIGKVIERRRGNEVRRFDGGWVRLQGRLRAAGALAIGLTTEVWDRARGSAGGDRCEPTC